jgi:hypothetical protein
MGKQRKQSSSSGAITRIFKSITWIFIDFEVVVRVKEAGEGEGAV